MSAAKRRSAQQAEEQFFVEVVEFETDKIERRLGPMSERKADRVEDGILSTLDLDRYYTRVVDKAGNEI